MERLLLKGKSKEDIALIASLAAKMGLTVEHLPDEIAYTVQEPDALAEWGTLSAEQQQGIYDALEDVKLNGGKSHDEVMTAMRKKYE
jgi:argininosuccinate lyase